MGSPYRWLVFVHVASILLLLLLHGGVVAVTYALRQERKPERIAALLELSLKTFDSSRVFGRIFWIDFLVVVFSGIGLMVFGGFWRHAWPWLSIVVFIAIFAAMGAMGSGSMTEVRKAVGAPWVKRSGMKKPEKQPAGEPNPAGIEAALVGLRPGVLSAIGVGGFAVLLWLMMFKPF